MHSDAEREIVACRAYLQQLVDGKLDNQLPMQGRGSATQQEYNAELEKFMSTFKMQACLPVHIPGKISWACMSSSKDHSLMCASHVVACMRRNMGTPFA